MKLTEVKQQIFDAIEDGGSTMEQIAKRTGRTNDSARDHMMAMEKAGMVHRARVEYNVCFWFKDKAKASACLQAHRESKKAAPLVHIAVKVATKFETGAQIVVPKGVKVQECPSFKGLGFREMEPSERPFSSLGVGRYLPDEDVALRRLARKAAA
jgi:hypothetical protein